MSELKAPSSRVNADSAAPDPTTTNKDQADLPASKPGLVLIKDGYYKYTDILFDWHKCMNIWQKNAIKSLLNGDAMTHPDHPLHIPGQDGCELYLSTAKDGHQKLLFSLKQIEYLQYYVHETGLADPRVVYELMGGKDAGWPDDFDFDAVKVEEWVPLPSNVLLPKDLGDVKPVHLASLAAIKREIKRIASNNKAVKRERMLMRGTPTEQTRAEAEIDNETEGPGLRRGPMRQSYNKPDGESGRPDTWGEVKPGEEYKGWDNYPKLPKDESAPAQTPDTSVPPSPVLSTSLSDSVDLSLSTPPSILETHELDTPNEHYHHAQQAMLLASQGGLVAALSRQPDSVPEGEPSEDEKKIGRSLFVALDTVTSEKDESVMLEIGWSALWWQPVKAEDEVGEFEEMREGGHFIVQDHLLNIRNGEQKPDHRDNYLSGSSLPIKAEEVSSTISKLLADLSKKAGGGPTYIVVHLPSEPTTEVEAVPPPPAKLADLLKIGLFPNEWLETLRPTTTQYPMYGDMSGIGRTSIINAALLHQAVKPDQAMTSATTPAQNLEAMARELFKEDDDRFPKYLGNAGNCATCTIEVFISLLTEHDPNEPSSTRLKVPQTGSTPTETTVAETLYDFDVEEPSASVHHQEAPEGLKNPIEPSADGFVEVPQHPSDESPSGGSDSDDDGIQGVYYEDDEGEMVALGSETKDD